VFGICAAAKSLVEMFHSAFDPRSRHGSICDLVPTRSPAVVVILAGRTRLAGIARFGCDHTPALAHALGFRRGTTPSLATFSRLFDASTSRPSRPSSAGGSSNAAPTRATTSPRTSTKPRRGSRDGGTTVVHLLSGFAPTVQAVIGPLRVEAETNEHNAAPRLLGTLPSPAGNAVTGDAMFCRTGIADVPGKQGAEYILPVKDNRVTVTAKVAELLDSIGPFSPGGGRSGRVGGANREQRGTAASRSARRGVATCRMRGGG